MSSVDSEVTFRVEVDLEVFCRCHFFPHQSRPRTPRPSATLWSCKEIPCNPHYFKAREFSCLTDRQLNAKKVMECSKRNILSYQNLGDDNEN